MGYCYTKGSGLFLLADGMGGHPEGEVAAQMALQVVAALYQKAAVPEIADVKAFLHSAILVAHRHIQRYAAEKRLRDTPRTTLVAAIVQGGSAYWIHCGDSRLYFVRQGKLLVRTRDHSYLEQREGPHDANTASAGFNRNVLYTCLGSPSKPEFDMIGPVPLQQGDRIMLCSDGLWGTVDDATIVYHLAHKPVADSAPELVELALANGGRHCDNVTLVSMEWETPDTLEPRHDSVSTDSMDGGMFASTVQTDSLNSEIEDLDDATIERSIAEINETIRRSAARRG